MAPRQRTTDEQLMPFNLTLTPTQRKLWQAGADAMSKQLGVPVSLSLYIRKRMDEAAARDVEVAKKSAR